jgi:hypothetical protein
MNGSELDPDKDSVGYVCSGPRKPMQPPERKNKDMMHVLKNGIFTLEGGVFL